MKVFSRSDWQLVELVRTIDQGDAVSIGLSEPTDSQVIWHVRVDVVTDQGVYRLGDFRTRPPSAGDPPSRIVGVASCPGVRRWRVQFSDPVARGNGEADVQLSDGCCPGVVGVMPVTSQADVGPILGFGFIGVGIAETPLPAGVARNGVMLSSPRTNDASGIFLGGAGVTLLSGTPLYPGGSMWIPIELCSDIHAIAAVANQDLRFLRL